jgi:hypothetical protein
MIYFWPTEDGDFTMVTDAEDREVARLWALEEGMSPDDMLDCMLDSTQMAARAVGLFQWSADLIPGKEWTNKPRSVFPYGPFCVPTPPGGPQEETIAHVRNHWQPARIVVQREGACCSPLPPGQQGRVESGGLRRRPR